MVKHLLKITEVYVTRRTLILALTNKITDNQIHEGINALRNNPSNLSVKTQYSINRVYTQAYSALDWMRGLGSYITFCRVGLVTLDAFQTYFGEVREYNEKGRWLWRRDSYWSKVTIELAYAAEIDGNSNKSVTLKVNIQQN
jgi:hypothetical protein